MRRKDMIRGGILGAIALALTKRFTGINEVEASVEDNVTQEQLRIINQYFTELNTWTLTSTSWVANTDIETQDLYPYIYTIQSSLFKNDSVPLWDCMGTASTGIPTATEAEAIALVQDFYCNTSGITLYATDAPTVDIVLRVKGA